MPSAPFVVPPVLLALILVVSALAKIRDPVDTRSIFAQLRLPRFVHVLHFPRLLPWVELVLAAALVLVPGHWYLLPATATLLLFVAYLAVVARALTFGYPITCGCFGRLGLGWITRSTVWRNAWLVVTALVTWLDAWRGHGVAQRLGDLGGPDGGGWWWLAMTLLAMVVTGVVVHNESQPEPTLGPDTEIVLGQSVEPGELGQVEDEYPPIPIPYAVLDGPQGPQSVWQLSDGAARLLVFCDPTDAETGDLEEWVARWTTELPAVRVHVVGQASYEHLGSSRPGLADHLLGDADGTLSERLEVTAPGAVILGTDRLLAGGPVHGFDEIEELVAEAAEVLRVHAPG